MKKVISIITLFVLLISWGYSVDLESNPEKENTKIYTLFLSQGYGGAGKPPQSPLTNKELLSKLLNLFSSIPPIIKPKIFFSLHLRLFLVFDGFAPSQPLLRLSLRRPPMRYVRIASNCVRENY